MIIFYNKKTGGIEGTIDGRVHSEDHLKMWIGDKKETDRIICDWKPTGEETFTVIETPIYSEVIDEDGFTDTVQTGVKKQKLKNIEFEPDHKQKDLFIALDKGEDKLANYSIDIKNKLLVKK